MSASEYDYEKLGLKVGIEIHQQLDSKTKLFCSCPTELQGNRKPDFYIYRKHRPVLGESGEFDKAMLVEFLKKGDVVYEGYADCTCTYEFDETPPFKMDDEAIDIALEICLLFKMDIIDEMQICRKNYVDGSVPAGFQRTAAIGLNGKLTLANGKELGINSIFLEEDAARRTKTEGKTIYFRLDRLGIPLVEITTDPDLNTPDEVRDAAYRIGLLLRSTNKVKRIIGSTRQDINISIKDGARIEIKGVQKLDWIPPLIKNEIRRQLALISIRDKLKKLQEKGLSPDDIKNDPKDLTDLLKNTACKFVNAGIKKKQRVMGIKIPMFKGIYGVETLPNQRFGTEVAGKVKVLTKLKGIIHSDEDLEGHYNFSKEEIDSIKKELDVGENDLFVLLLGPKSELKKAFDIIVDRTRQAFNGVPPETRRADEGGITTFLRELSGGKRLYPDTDSREVIIDPERIERIRSQLKPYPWDLIPEYARKYKVDEGIFEEMIVKGQLELFDKLIGIIPNEPMLVIKTISDLTKSLRRDGFAVDNLTDKHYIALFNALKEKKIAKEAFEKILQEWSKNPSLSIEKIIEKVGITRIDLSELDKIIRDIVEKNKDLVERKGMGAMGPLMGDLMKKLGRGAVDGKELSNRLRKILQEKLKK